MRFDGAVFSQFGVDLDRISRTVWRGFKFEKIVADAAFGIFCVAEKCLFRKFVDRPIDRFSVAVINKCDRRNFFRLAAICFDHWKNRFLMLNFEFSGCIIARRENKIVEKNNHDAFAPVVGKRVEIPPFVAFCRFVGVKNVGRDRRRKCKFFIYRCLNCCCHLFSANRKDFVKIILSISKNKKFGKLFRI